jgi:hypothetical protein
LNGKLGGMPWTIFAATIDNWLETAYVPFEWKFDGPRSSYKAGTEIQAALDSMRNPVSSLEAGATVLLPNGIVSKEIQVTATRTFSVFSKGLKIAAPGKYGFYTMVEHGNERWANGPVGAGTPMVGVQGSGSRGSRAAYPAPIRT